MERWTCLTVADQVGRPDSALSTFFAETLPHRRVVAEEWRRILGHAPTAGIAVDDGRTVVGKAFEIRVGLDLADIPGYQRLLAFLPAHQCDELLVAVGFGDPHREGTSNPSDPMLRFWTRVAYPIRADDPAQRGALSSCFDAACWDAISHNAGEDWPIEQCRRGFGLLPRVKADHQRTTKSTSALTGLLHLWEGYLRHARRQLLDLGERVVVEPCLAPGFAIGDLIVGRTMVEVKTYLDPLPHVDSWLDQLLAYALLDQRNVFCLTDIALFAGWQATVCRSSLESILRTGAPGATPVLGDLRKSLHEVLETDLGLAFRSHMHKRYPPPPDAWVSADDEADQPRTS